MATAGMPFSITVTALDSSGHTVSGFNGTITLSSSPGSGITPASVAVRNGTTTLSVTLTAAGTQTLTAAFTGLASGSSVIAVSSGPFAGYLVSFQAPSNVQAGTGFVVFVQAADHTATRSPATQGRPA